MAIDEATATAEFATTLTSIPAINGLQNTLYHLEYLYVKLGFSDAFRQKLLSPNPLKNQTGSMMLRSQTPLRDTTHEYWQTVHVVSIHTSRRGVADTLWSVGQTPERRQSLSSRQTRTNAGLMLGHRRRRCPALTRHWFYVWGTISLRRLFPPYVYYSDLVYLMFVDITPMSSSTRGSPCGET